MERFRFVSENYLCEKCNDRFVNEANVMIHIRSVHDEDIRKMFAIDASENLEADEEYHLWLNAITDIKGFIIPMAFTMELWERPLNGKTQIP